MGAASKMAARHGKVACDDCHKPFGPGRSIASFSDEPLEAICQWCDLARAFHREYTELGSLAHPVGRAIVEWQMNAGKEGEEMARKNLVERLATFWAAYKAND